MNNHLTIPSRRTTGFMLVLTALILVVFWPVGGYNFLNYDDPVYVTANAMVQKGFSRDGLLWALTTREAGFWHPLTWLSLMADYELFGLNAGGFHWTNVIFHTGNTLLLFWVMRAMTGRETRSFLLAALFAVHPLHVEPVAWISSRKDVLSGFFWMLTMMAYHRYVCRPRPLAYGVVGISFVMALMAKPMAVTLPLVMLLLDFWPLKRFEVTDGTQGHADVSQGLKGQRRQVPILLIVEKLPLLFISTLFGLLTYEAERAFDALSTEDALPWGSRLATAAVGFVFYLVKTFCPIGLAAFYPHPGSWSTLVIVVSCSIIVVLSLLAMAAVRIWPSLSVGWGWYVITIVPVSGIIPVGSHAMADRYAYIPIIGLFLMVCWLLLGRKCRSTRSRWAAAAIAGSALVLLMAVSVHQVAYWQNDGTLFGRAVEVTKNNYVAHSGLAWHLAESGELMEALGHLQRAVAMRPDYTPAWFKMGIVHSRQGNYREATACFQRIVNLSPAHLDARRQLSWHLTALGRRGEAIAVLEDTVRIKPDDDYSYNQLGVLLAETGAYERAERCFRKAVELNPGHGGYRYNLDRLLEGREGAVHRQRDVRMARQMGAEGTAKAARPLKDKKGP